MKKRWLDVAMELLSLPTAPQYEDAVVAWLEDFARRRGIRVRTDRHGNLLMHYRRGRAAARPFVFAAHMDHPGFAAERMTKPGMLLARWRGGVPPKLFPGARVRFFADGAWVKGRVVGSAKKHVMGKPRPTLVRVERAVPPGSVGMWDFGEPTLRGNLLRARGHDDVAGVAAIAAALDEARRTRLRGEFYAFFTRGEEAGMLGAVGASKSRTLSKKWVLVPLETSRELPNARIGDGVVLRVGDLASIFTPSVTALIRAAADGLAKRRKSFRYQRRLMDGGSCESTAYIAYGYDAGGLCLPLGNYHNVDWKRMRLAPEYIDVRDYGCLVELLLELASYRAKPSSGPASRAFWERHFRRFPLRPLGATRTTRR